MSKRIYLSILCVVFQTLGLFAQSGINSTVRVEREYEGKVIEADKSKLNTSVSDTLLNFKLHFDYPTFYHPYRDLYEFSPMSAAPIRPAGVVKYPWFYTKLSLGYPWIPLAEVYIAPRFGPKFSALLYYNHKSLWNNSLGDRMKNDAGVNLTYRWKKGEAHIDVGYSGNYYTYMNDSVKVSDHRFDIFSVLADVRSKNTASNSFYYDISLAYSHLKDNQSNPLIGTVGENSVTADISLGATLKRVHKVFVQLKNDLSIVDNLSENRHYTAGVFDIRPTYRWERGRWRLNLGVSVSSLYHSGDEDFDDKFVFSPDVSATFETVPSKLWIYATVDGENSILSMSRMFKYNPWMGGDYNIGRTVSPFGAKIGLRGVAGEKFAYNLYGGYRYYQCYTSFISYNDAQAAWTGANNSAFAGAEIRLNTKPFNMTAEVQYQYFSDREYALMTPSLYAGVTAEYNIRQRFFVQASCHFNNRMLQGELLTDGKVEYSNVRGFVDLGLKLTYVVNPGFAIFLEGNNLTNSKIQYFSQAYEPGLNIAAGLYFKL